MKLIIQIPCYNEEKGLKLTLDQLPKELEGFDVVERLVINDGCTDKTVQVAQECEVEHVLNIERNKGLSNAFKEGIRECLKLQADVIVNLDADNQYNADYLPDLVTPILNKKADIVIGNRQVNKIKHFSFIKKILQKFGSFVVRVCSKTNVVDAPSGFRAFNREAALNLNVFNDFTYTLETIIQAGEKNLTVINVPVEVNENLRKSRLYKNILHYLIMSAATIIRMFVVYNPFKFFFSIGLISFVLGLLISLRFLYFYVFESGQGHIQSLILSAILLGMGVQTMLVAFLADLLAVNRKLLEKIQYKLRKSEFNK